MILWKIFLLLVLPSPLLGNFGEAPYSLTLEWEDLSSNSETETEVISAQLRASAPLLIKENAILSLMTRHERFFYTAAPSLPFNQLTESSIGLFSLTQLAPDWKAMTINTLQASAADGVSLDDSLTFSGIYGVWYSGWENLIIGSGVGVSTQLDDTTTFFPLLLLDWEISPGWNLTTRPTPGTRFGPGLSILYQPEAPWALYTGVRYLKSAYQLKNDRIYTVRSTRLFTTLQYQLSEHLSLSGTVGIRISGEREHQETTTELDPGFFSGIDLSWNF